MKKLLILFLVLAPMLMMAQRPKMHIKLYGGVNAGSLVYKIEDVQSDILAGIQLGGGFRIKYRKAFGEIDFAYRAKGITIIVPEAEEVPFNGNINIIMRGFEVPVLMGYVPVRTPIFGCYLYGGITNVFSLKGWLTIEDEKYTFKPSEVNLHFYNLGARLGAQFDVAMFNFDLSYTIGITNHFREDYRTNSHVLMFNIGVLF